MGEDQLADAVDSELQGIPGTSLDAVVPQPMFSETGPDSGTSYAIMKERSEWEVCAKLSSRRVEPKCAARRLQRRLQLRRFKRMLGLPLFDIDSAVKGYMSRPQLPWPDREIDRLGLSAVSQLHQDHMSPASSSSHSHSHSPAGCSMAGSAGTDTQLASKEHGPSASGQASSADTGQTASVGSHIKQPLQHTPYIHSFASRLLGRAVMRNNLTSPVPKISPFHGRLLRPFIWRDWKDMSTSSGADLGRGYSTRSLSMLHVQRSIRSCSHPILEKMELAPDILPSQEAIDYVFFQKEHLDQVNSLLCRTFWPGIDMSEALLYPEFSIVALYKRNAVGCAFLTPDAYLTYIAVAAGWEGAGIATFMIYHLVQTVPTKDITLHVSATNPAMLLYQKFGFKPEKYVVDFYQTYLPESSRLCRNAFFMRLRRY
ncbi:hypothetical protein GGI12_003760 [Dipsacomyces acuminosporus]|nr:hypothetical protein GGI12_003760 [Dipsacomyces acuminosporus]